VLSGAIQNLSDIVNKRKILQLKKPLQYFIYRRFPHMPQTTCRVLCIEDHTDTSEMLKLLLSQEDYEVLTALSCEEALQLATGQEFDLYVLDRRLPDGSGLQLCRDLSEATPGVPCIFYSGDAYDIHRSEAL